MNCTGQEKMMQVEYRDDGIYVTLLGDKKLQGRFAEYEV